MRRCKDFGREFFGAICRSLLPTWCQRGHLPLGGTIIHVNILGLVLAVCSNVALMVPTSSSPWEQNLKIRPKKRLKLRSGEGEYEHVYTCAKLEVVQRGRHGSFIHLTSHFWRALSRWLV